MQSIRRSFSRSAAPAAFLFLSFALGACGDDDDGGTGPDTSDVSLTLTNFPVSSPAQGHYELWISFAGSSGARHETEARSMGKFRVGPLGTAVALDGDPDPFDEPSDAVWPVAVDAYVTIEPDGDTDPAPTFPGFIADEIKNRKATLTTAGADAIGFSFSGSTGSCVLATPSTSDATDETEGVWFTTGDGAASALTLPALPADGRWIYQGWVSRSTGIASLGRFFDPAAADDDLSGPLHGSGGRIDQNGFPFPGSDFPFAGDRTVLEPAGAFITLEPVGDLDGPDPFILRVLQGSWGLSSGGGAHALANVSMTLPTASLSIPRE